MKRLIRILIKWALLVLIIAITYKARGMTLHAFDMMMGFIFGIMFLNTKEGDV